MTIDVPARFYAVLDASASRDGTRILSDIYRSDDPGGLRSFLGVPAAVEIERPSLRWDRTSDGRRVDVPRLIAAFRSEQADVLLGFLPAARRQTDVVVSVGADPAISVADHWCPAKPDQTFFGTRQEARSLIGADALGTALSGDGVNVVIVDQGLNKTWLDTYFPGRYAGGWPFTPQGTDPRPAQPPGATPVEDARHGLMIARNVLDIAPKVSLYDLPLIPPRIDHIPLFLSEAHAAFLLMLDLDIYQRGGTWILVNAWAIFDRRSEAPFLGDYTEDEGLTSPAPHLFTRKIAEAIDNKIDVIFCAGNCGQFCPDDRCGANESGPGRSIWGANSFHRVLTVGAVRTDGTWIGYSSQGPGQPKLGKTASLINRKPDLCLPSDFAENLDAHALNRGTSAATGVAAGVVAALRSNDSSGKPVLLDVKPELLNLALNATARQPLAGDVWNPRFGHGILDVGEALKLLQPEQH